MPSAIPCANSPLLVSSAIAVVMLRVTDMTGGWFRRSTAEYDAQCQREGVVDFAELLLRCYDARILHRSAGDRTSRAPATIPPKLSLPAR